MRLKRSKEKLLLVNKYSPSDRDTQRELSGFKELSNLSTTPKIDGDANLFPSRTTKAQTLINYSRLSIPKTKVHASKYKVLNPWYELPVDNSQNKDKEEVSLPVISKNSFDLQTNETHKLLNRAIININQPKENLFDLSDAKIKHLKHVEQTKFKCLKFMS